MIKLELIRCPVRDLIIGMVEPNRKDRWVEDNKYCSFCGSIHPELLFKWIEEQSCVLRPMDSIYKVGVNGFRVFCFPHFTQEQQHKFINRYRDGLLRLMSPGHFTVLPYFMSCFEKKEQNLIKGYEE